ncbi:probable FeS assembly SUF system protein SufT [Idiomarina zobellii]|nr:probable FeS assembly SUF system protein SufT [Idiomarina zobellii]
MWLWRKLQRYLNGKDNNSMQQKMVNTLREVKARKVPSGEPKIIPKGEFVNITQDLGGNYTVTWQGNMLRIDGTDGDAIGRKPEKLDFPAPEDGQISEQQVWDALETIYDPEIPINLVSLGLIYKVDIDQDSSRVNIDMTLTAPGCGMGPVLVGDVEYRVSLVPNVDKVNVNLVFDPPWSRDMMSEEAQLEAGVFF